MSDDEADPELLELLRQSLGLGRQAKSGPSFDTKVLAGAQHVFDNSVDVALDPFKTKAAAETIWQLMQKKRYSTKKWAEHELHPQAKDANTVDFIFTMDLLNFSFWSDEADEAKQFAIEYRGNRWKGYWSLVAALQRALDEEIPITSSDFWQNEDECTEEVLRHVFRSATDEEIPMFQERLDCLREAGKILYDKYRCSFTSCIEEANGSAAVLVNLIADNFPCFRDRTRFEGKEVRFYKRAQILVADLWACFRGKSYGKFHDIDKLTMFADYRIPQMLHTLGCLLYSPPLETHIRKRKLLPSGHRWETELRGTSIWCIELIRREIEKQHAKMARPGMYAELTPQLMTASGSVAASGSVSVRGAGGEGDVGDDEKGEVVSADAEEEEEEEEEKEEKNEAYPLGVNAVLIDFMLYDSIKEMEGEGKETIPHHRTRSIWY
ncbi:conserved hypothetical protein [Histoplasma capsulatum G186AR]|uniref:Queuosine 5'-phosphate N-glycosylase/hydrolase n=2 Tax=Ajellomyces capsulatus TaxID=5037 RepID=C0NRQ3_AJECG|nr:uncharacterized protein HCBG_05833 [Histoplasma capsulatum G186AR]EEH05569.1 conserved hypothetical protein [Histoplasma capsulatum G186AR]KAG5298734.1 DUF2419 superfamily domain-containing protein [Histoplasma capsulatum]QSS67077.1 DUF2419 superfamily domain-containing protein [Histoplasma capsulatum G186AR]